MATQTLLNDEAAGPEARAVFADIRQKRNTDYVNNFWRVLAHDPALLKATHGSACNWSWRRARLIRWSRR